MLLQFQINEQLICRVDCEHPVADSRNFLYAQFDFSEEWQGRKTAIFNNGTAYNVILDENNKCLVPWEVITDSGFSVSVFCGDRVTANTAYVDVITSGYIEGQTPQPPSPSVYDEILKELDAKVETIKAGTNVTVERNGNIVTISAQGGGSSDYETLQNKPSINSVELVGNKTLEQLGIQPSGNYATKEELQAEENARIDADSNLQTQIDAITVSSDVVDVVGTYQDLQNYDTSHIKANDIIKVLQDSTHNDALSYYRWVITENIGAWSYVGSEGPFYTKGEANEQFQTKITFGDTLNLLGDVLNVADDYIENSTGRKALDLTDDSTGHAGTSGDPVQLDDITAGFYDITNGGYICTNPSGENPNARRRELPTGGMLYTDELWAWFIDVDGEVYLVDIAGAAYESWGDAQNVDMGSLKANLANFLSKAEAVLTYQPKNRYITNTTVALAAWEEEATPTYADYPYKATIAIQDVTAGTWAYIVWGQQIDEVYPDCNTVQGGIEIFASEPVAITIPTIKIEG